MVKKKQCYNHSISLFLSLTIFNYVIYTQMSHISLEVNTSPLEGKWQCQSREKYRDLFMDDPLVMNT